MIWKYTDKILRTEKRGFPHDIITSKNTHKNIPRKIENNRFCSDLSKSKKTLGMLLVCVETAKLGSFIGPL